MGTSVALPLNSRDVACLLPKFRPQQHRRAPLGRNSFLSGSPISACRMAKRAVSRSCVAFADGAISTQAQNPFQQTRELDSVQRVVGGLPRPTLYLAAIAFVAASGGLGWVLGSQAPASARAAARWAGGALFAAASVAAVRKLQEKRAAAAGLELYNLLAGMEDPSALTREQVLSIGNKYGVDVAAARVDEAKSIYDAFIQSVIPVNQPLRGDEADRIAAFKGALGLTNEDAAASHIDVGRRFQRQASEADSRMDAAEQRKALHKLVYVSGLVFGEQQAAFLLPWKRIFGYTDASLFVAKRDNAKALFKSFLDSQGGLQADREALAAIKRFQDKIRCGDDIAEEVVREAARASVESRLEKAVVSLKKRTRTRDTEEIMEEVRAVLNFSRGLETLAGDPSLPKGLGSVNIYGGRFEANNKTRDLRDLYRVFVEEQLKATGAVTDEVEDDYTDLQQILALGKKEAAEIVSEVTSRAYRQLLRDEVASGRMDAEGAKPAKILEALCERLNFDGDAAMALHRQLYRQKLDSLLEKKSLTDGDAAELDRQRRLLCIPRADIRQIHRDTCGRLYQAAVEDALSAGIERFTLDDRKRVRSVANAVRLDPEIARSILGDCVRRAFLGYVTRSRNKANRLEAAKELKAMVFFSNGVVAPLLADIKALEERAEEARKEAASKEIAELMVKAKQQAEEEAAAEQAAAAGAGAAESSVESADESPSEPEATQETASSGKEEGVEPAAAAALEGGIVSESSAEKEDPESEAPDAAMPESLKKSKDAAAKREQAEQETEGKAPEERVMSQKEITLRDDLELRDRLDIYRNFLLYCMSGDVVTLPMGTQVQVQRDESEFARLAQLGDVLGLSQIDVATVHQGLAEQAFRQQVQMKTAGASLTKETIEGLEKMREQFGLSKEAAGKIIKGAQNQHLISNLQAAKATGDLTLEKILDMREAGVEVDQFLSDELRLNLYAKEIAEVLSNGTGEFDDQRLLVDLPQQLSLKERQVKQKIQSLAQDRKRTTLVQAISYLRQRKLDEAVKSLNNLLACNKAQPSEEPASWDPAEELQDLWSVYIGKEASSDKQEALRELFAIPEGEAASLRDLVQAGSFRLAQEAEEEAIF